MNFLPYDSREDLAAGVAAAMAAQLQAAIAQEGRATLCVAGGTTPAPAFAILAAAPLDWSKVTILPTDERWVDEKDARSNAALVKKHLMVGAAAQARYVSLYAPADTPDAALAGLAQAIVPHLPITVLLAGMGADLHTASLFPDSDRIDAAMRPDAPPLMVMTTPSQPEARMTLTAPVLRAARHQHIMMTGAEKRAVLEGLRADTPTRAAPVSILLARAQVHWAG